MIICVRGLSSKITEDELRQEFMAFGEVASVTVFKDKGFGFVDMPSDIEGSTAIAGLSGKVINGRKLEISEDEGAKAPGC